jgi:hypothetical protein
MTAWASWRSVEHGLVEFRSFCGDLGQAPDVGEITSIAAGWTVTISEAEQMLWLIRRQACREFHDVFMTVLFQAIFPECSKYKLFPLIPRTVFRSV